MRRVDPGYPYPLGATPDDTGANFALFSDNAEAVTLCLFDYTGQQEIERIALRECTNGIWHCHLPGVGRGQVYGWRVSGPWAPNEGHRFNDAKLLIDPYARSLVGDLIWDDALYGYTIGGGDDADLVKDDRDLAPYIPKARIFPATPLVATSHPRNSWPKTVIYEAHVRGLTMRHPFLAEEVRGTFAAMSTPAMIAYLERLGITAIEFMPVQAFTQDRHLVERGLANYWGYNTLSFFAPEPRYLDGSGLEDIAIAVDRLHQSGIEVILDVVYNHTCEGNHFGPTLSWRGIDNAAYYRLLPDNPRYYDNLTGCGNSVNTEHPRVLQMVLDSLRMWATVYGIDGFRFDLATTLGRRADGFDPHHAFFNAILQDPVLGRTKLIAEPWDIGPGGYQLGAFPPGFSEWNGDYRDVVRDFWVGSEGMLGAFASRFAASSDLFGAGHKRPWSSVNFVTAHDGFTLDDLVSYNDKHNEANGEDNRDGHDDNRSWNCGVEGESNDPAILSLRKRQKRNLLATLFLSQGVPMLLAGDEFGNSQGGNNNAYCQDNEISWVDWQRQDPDLVAFVAKVTEIRKSHSAVSRPEFLTGARNARGQPDVVWYGADGKRMTPQEWDKPHVKCLTVLLSPVLAGEPSVLVMFNASHHDVEFRLPEGRKESFIAIVDTAETLEGGTAEPGKPIKLVARSLIVWDLKGVTQARDLEVPVEAAPCRFGASPDLDGTVFRLYAPSVGSVELLRPGAHPAPMAAGRDGFFELRMPGIVPGALYRFRADGLDFADPASRGQDRDADGWSVVPQPMPPGSGRAIRPWHEAVIAEVHVGAATPEGSFAALSARLDHFAQAGFTVIEIMPVADFAGRWNWGYDGVLPFAPDRSYGTPAALRALVDAAHERGLGVVLDVVYNHFGPAGNYLNHYAKPFFAATEQTPWGPAIALDNPVVRAFFCDNARMWLDAYDMDGLRFDAVHAFRTEGAPLLLAELAEACRSVKPDAWLILENDDNGAGLLERSADGTPLRYTAQWNDDYHHVFTVAAGADATAHLRDYAEGTIDLAARAMAQGFVYQGEAGPHRGTARGEPSAALPPEAFIAFVQNHDQIGNRPMGDRLVDRFAEERVACLRFLAALGPNVPLFFMGEEALLDTPFPFFCDFPGELGDAVRRGRRDEFRPFFESHAGSADDLPDPLAEATFQSAKIDWDRLAQEPYRGNLARFRALAAERRRIVWPLVASAYRGSTILREGDALAVTWRFEAGALTLALNLSDEPSGVGVAPGKPDAQIGAVQTDAGRVTLGPWSAALFAGPPR